MYVILESQSIETIQVAVSPRIPSIEISSVAPGAVGMGGQSTLTLLGSSLDAVSRVTIERDDGIEAYDAIVVVSPTPGRALATFALPLGASPGAYRLEAETATGSVIPWPTPIEVRQPSAAPAVLASVAGPSEVRSGQRFPLSINYANTSDFDLPAPMAKIEGTDGFAEVFELRGSGGVLRLSPLETDRRIRQRSIDDVPVTYTLSVALPTGPFPWSDIIEWTPPGGDPDQWAALVAAVRSRIGETWEDVFEYMDAPTLRRAFATGARDESIVSMLTYLIGGGWEGEAGNPQGSNQSSADLAADGVGSAPALEAGSRTAMDTMGSQITYTDIGPIDGPVIILQHGQGGTGTIESLNQRVQALADLDPGYRVIIPDATAFTGERGNINPLSDESVFATAGRISSIADTIYGNLQSGSGLRGPVNPAGIASVIGHSFGNKILEDIGVRLASETGMPFPKHIALNVASTFPGPIFEGAGAVETWAFRVDPIADDLSPFRNQATPGLKDFHIRANPCPADDGGIVCRHGAGVRMLEGMTVERLKDFILMRDPDLASARRNADGFNGEVSENNGVYLSPNFTLDDLLQVLNYEPFVPVGSHTVEPVASFDPNDILGPEGFGPGRWIQSGGVHHYTIRCENLVDATAAAAQVFISQSLEPDLDWSTLRFVGFGIGEYSFTLPSDVATYQARVDLTGEAGVLADVWLDFNPALGLVIVDMLAIDPVSGLPPIDPSVGLLPPNTDPPSGEAWVSYTVRSRPNLPTGREISAFARIFFDANDPIDTPIWTNTIDNDPPIVDIGSVRFNSASTVEAPFTVLGSGVGAPLTDVFVYGRRNGLPYVPLAVVEPSSGVAMFRGVAFERYELLAVGRDGAGNMQALDLAGPPESTTIFDAVPDDRIDVEDFYQWLNWASNGDSRADVNGDGEVDAEDMQLVISAIFSGK